MSDCNQRDYRNMRSMTGYSRGTAYSYNNNNRHGNHARYNNEHQNHNCCEHNRSDMHCHHKTDDMIDGMPIAMGYVPWQRWRSVYEPEKAMKRYTIFEELDKPFMGCRGGKGR